MTVKIVTDSTADLPPKLVDELGITIVPLNVHFGTETYRDGLDISADEFYKRLVSGPILPKTSAPSPGAFKDVYNKLGGNADGIVSIHISSKLSATCDAALAGKRESSAKCPIEAINSNTVSLALGFLVIAAARAAKAGARIEEVVKIVQDSISQAGLIATLDTLEFLQKGGRVGKAQAWLGSLLSVKPLICVRDGEVHPLERVRTHSKAIERLFELLKERQPVKEVGVVYTTQLEEAKAMMGRVQEVFPGKQVYLSRFGPVLGTYAGPGALAVMTLR